MKKECKIFAGLLFLALVLAVFLHTSFVSAVFTGEPQQPGGSTLLPSPENIPSTPGELTEMYLKQEWGKIIASKPFIGPIHTYFTEHSLLFKILFNEPYEISPTLFFVILLWVWAFIWSSKILASSGLVKSAYSWLAGFAFAVVLAHIMIFNFIASAISSVALSQSSWWARAIIFIAAFVMIIVVNYLSAMINREVKMARAAKAAKELKHKVEKGEALRKGLETGSKMVEDFT